jgi:predicted ATPase
MATIKKFIIKKFKGIEEVEIDLLGRTNCPVLTLIGLNESGKTTILEGISHFVSDDRSVSGLFDGVHAKTSGSGLIPLHKKAAFTSNIEISGIVEFSESDLEEISEMAKSHRYQVDLDELKKPFPITQTYIFEDSVLKDTKNYWQFNLLVRKSNKAQFNSYNRPKKPSDDPDLWYEVVQLLRRKLPLISYFPTFLVDMPERIYLKEHAKERPVNRYYRLVFQDILNSLDDGLSLEKHVSNRIIEYKDAQKNGLWYSSFFSSPIKSTIDSVFQRISNAVTKEVLGSWRRVFQRAISAQSIFVEWGVDIEKDDMPYASFIVSDGESRYAISERSLGFRWFFSFLLFTAFKPSDKRSTLFIFDEPAANLHAKAQAELLTSFSKIASDDNKIIYSTHSHHMINPMWLSGAYIVENTAIDYEDSEDNFGFNTKPTNIKATKYREFVSKYPSRSSYFQPVIEKLEYISPEVLGSPPFLLVEGVSDYYALRLAEIISKKKMTFSILPGVGAGACGPQISQMLGRGEKFVILLDDDKAGKKAEERYKTKWFLTDETVITLAAIAPDFVGKQIEALLDIETLQQIQSYLSIEGLPSKQQIGWYLAEACAMGSPDSTMLSETTLRNLLKVLDFFKTQFRKN